MAPIDVGQHYEKPNEPMRKSDRLPRSSGRGDAMHRVFRLLIAAGAVVALLASVPAQAATPGSGTLSKAGQKLSWTGSFTLSTLELGCAIVPACDHYKLKISMGDGARVRVQIPAPNPATDIDFVVYDPKGVEVASSGNLPGEDEAATFTHKGKFRNQIYDVEVDPYLAAPAVVSYNATASVSKYVK
jgi:hypothetical protein